MGVLYHVMNVETTQNKITSRGWESLITRKLKLVSLVSLVHVTDVNYGIKFYRFPIHNGV
jgi:hypothetical protein